MQFLDPQISLEVNFSFENGWDHLYTQVQCCWRQGQKVFFRFFKEQNMFFIHYKPILNVPCVNAPCSAKHFFLSKATSYPLLRVDICEFTLFVNVQILKIFYGDKPDYRALTGWVGCKNWTECSLFEEKISIFVLYSFKYGGLLKEQTPPTLMQV